MALWIAATAIAFFVKGLCGFANTLVFTSILAFGTSNINISPVELLLGYPSNLIMIWRNRRRLDLKVCGPIALLVILGSIPGAFLLKNLDPRLTKVLFGAVVILLGVEMALREANRLRFRESKALLGVIGVLSGVLSGMFGVGALLAAYVSRVTGSDSEFKANVSAVFFAENTFRLALYGAMGIFTLASVKQVLILLPFMLGGLFLGIRSGEVLNERTARRVAIALLILSGVLMIVQNL